MAREKEPARTRKWSQRAANAPARDHKARAAAIRRIRDVLRRRLLHEAIRAAAAPFEEEARRRALHFEKEIWGFLEVSQRERKRADRHPIASDPHFLEALSELRHALRASAWGGADAARARIVSEALGPLQPARARLRKKAAEARNEQEARVWRAMAAEAKEARARFPRRGPKPGSPNSRARSPEVVA